MLVTVLAGATVPAASKAHKSGALQELPNTVVSIPILVTRKDNYYGRTLRPHREDAEHATVQSTVEFIKDQN